MKTILPTIVFFCFFVLTSRNLLFCDFFFFAYIKTVGNILAFPADICHCVSWLQGLEL